MAYIVTQNCRDCKYTDCVEVCPVEAFHNGPNMVYINPEVCIDCDVCVAQCPVEAIFPEDQVPEEFQEYIQINAEEAPKHPTIAWKQDPLPTAVTLEEIQAKKS